MVASIQIGLVALCTLIPAAFAQFNWATFTNAAAPQTGKATFYGPGGDAQGTCSYGPNFANTLGLPATANTVNTIALNDVDFSVGLSCGMCVMYIGTGGGIGTTPISTSTWTFAQVTNRCPECAKGSIDINTGGDGIWAEQWYAVDCNVGASSMTYSVTQGSQYYFEMVVSNARNPITAVSAQIGGAWLPLTRTTNNQWAYYNSQGPYSFPMPIQVTCINGAVVQDTMLTYGVTAGKVQCPPTTGAGASATPAVAAATPAAPSPPPPSPAAVAVAATAVASPPPSPVVAAAVGSPPPPTPIATAANATVANAVVTASSVANPNVNTTATAILSPSPAAAVASPPPPKASPPPPATNATVAAVAVASPPPPTPTPTTASPATGPVILNWAQCGGTGSYCGMLGATCVDAQWPGVSCNSGFFCNRYDATWWQCQPYGGAGFGRGTYSTVEGRRRMSRRLAASTLPTSSL